MNKILYVAFSMLLMTGTFALEKTKEEKVAKYVLENIQKDYTSCYAFYLIAAESFKQDKIVDTLAKNKQVVAGLEKSADIALKFSHDLGEVLELKPETMTKNIKKELKKISAILKKQMQGRGSFCKKLIEDQKQRIGYWEDKGNKRIK